VNGESRVSGEILGSIAKFARPASQSKAKYAKRRSKYNRGSLLIKTNSEKQLCSSLRIMRSQLKANLRTVRYSRKIQLNLQFD
jgi:hypothetical protein